MIERFFPDEEFKRVEDINIEFLMKENIKGLILDIDNTISEWKMEPTEDVMAWLDMMKENGIKLCLASNNRRARADYMSSLLGINAVHNSLKPSRRAFIAAMRLMGTNPSETAVVGDQVFTDIYGGNRLNLYTIFITPINVRDGWFVKFKRPLEKWVLKSFREKLFIRQERRKIWKMRSGRRKLKKCNFGM